jgi:hypothetical protein
VRLVKEILERLHIHSERLSLQWASAAEASRFVNLIGGFSESIKKIGLLGRYEGLSDDLLQLRLKAAKSAMEQNKLRLIFAKEAESMKDGDGSKAQLEDHKLSARLQSALTDEIAKQSVLLSLEKAPRSVKELSDILDLPCDRVETYIGELEKKELLDRGKIVAQ